MLFPFLGLSEFWEYLYVIIPSAVIAYSGVWLLRNIDRLTEGSGTDSLQEYIDNLKKRFKDQKRKHQFNDEVNRDTTVADNYHSDNQVH